MSAFTETFTFRQMDTVTLTPPSGWEIWAVENTDRRGNHQITFYADESRKPGATVFIMAGNRPFAYTEAGFLAQINEWYMESAYQYTEKTPSFRKINIDNGIAYYFTAQFAAYAGLPPADGRAKVGGLLFIYQENNPVAAATLYVDDPLDPALDVMIKVICGIQMSFPEYKSNIYRFNERNALKIDIPQTWHVKMNGAETRSGVSYTLTVTTDNDVRFLGLITIIVPAQPSGMTRERLFVMLEEESNTYALQSVEGEAVIIPINTENSYGGYYTLTDADLVNRTPDPDEYKIFTRFLIQFDCGALTSVTAFMDDVQTKEYMLFESAVLKMEPF